MTPRPPWPRRFEWRQVQDRVRLVEIVVQDIGDQEMIRLELSVPQAQQLLAQQDRLLVAIARARQHGRLANDAGAAAGGAA